MMEMILQLTMDNIQLINIENINDSLQSQNFAIKLKTKIHTLT